MGAREAGRRNARPVPLFLPKPLHRSVQTAVRIQGAEATWCPAPVTQHGPVSLGHADPRGACRPEREQEPSVPGSPFSPADPGIPSLPGSPFWPAGPVGPGFPGRPQREEAHRSGTGALTTPALHTRRSFRTLLQGLSHPASPRSRCSPRNAHDTPTLTHKPTLESPGPSGTANPHLVARPRKAPASPPRLACSSETRRAGPPGDILGSAMCHLEGGPLASSSLGPSEFKKGVSTCFSLAAGNAVRSWETSVPLFSGQPRAS